MGRGRWNGYRLTDGTDILDFADRLRDVLGPVRDRLDAEMLVGRAIRRLDLDDVHGRPRHFAPLLGAMTDHDEAQRKVADRDRDSRAFDPHRFTVTLARDPQTRRILALLYCEQPALVEAWQALPEVEDYHHQSFTDRPADIDEDEWAARAAAWQRVVPDLSAPNERMLTFTLRTEPPHDTSLIRLATAISGDEHDPQEASRRALLADVAPSLRSRALSLATNLLTQEWAARRTAVLGTEPTAPETLRFVRALARLPLEGEQPCEPVVAGIEALLDPDPLPYVTNGADLSTASSAEIRALIAHAEDRSADSTQPVASSVAQTLVTTWLDSHHPQEQPS